jgi:hypothetical protein
LPNFVGRRRWDAPRPFTSFLSLRYHVRGFKVGVETPDHGMTIIIQRRNRFFEMLPPK